MAAFGANDYVVYMAADALVEVASQMKALEARVTALSSSCQSSPTSAPAQATAESVDRGCQADSASSISFNKALGGSVMSKNQAGQQTLSSARVSGHSSQAVHDSSASGPKAAAGSGVTNREAASRAVSSTGPQGRAGEDVSLVPDLITFSPAISARPTGLNQQPAGTGLPAFRSPQQSQQAAPSHNAFVMLNSAHVIASKQQQQAASQLAHSSQALVSGQQQIQAVDGAALVTPAVHVPSLEQPKEAAGLLQSDHFQAAGNVEKANSALLPDSRTGSPLPGGSFYNNAVFGSPTPTPSPQRDVLGSEHSLLSPGSSPRPQHRGLLHPSTLGSNPAGESACCCCFPMAAFFEPMATL